MGDGGNRRTRLAGRRATDGHTTAVGSAEEIAWLVAHLQAVVVASPAAWADRGMTLLHFSSVTFSLLRTFTERLF
jgi:hypothetical protein